MKQKRVGLYSWAGPGTIRMIAQKYFSPRIDENSIMSAYDYDYLSRVKDLFGITDVWASYSWGFSAKRERQDYEFLKSKLDNFKKLNLKVHAYIQGTNLVYEDYKGKDWFCSDEKGRPITYYKGRRMTCLNNPGFQDYVFDKISSMLKLPVDGIFMDNVVMGQIPPPFFKKGLPYIFAGCRCRHCQKKFTDETGYEIPKILTKKREVSEKYLLFRTKSTTEFVARASKLVRSNNFEFGTNSYDPKHNTKLMYGTDLGEIEKLQDYLLFENHSLPRARGQKNNKYIHELSLATKKPVFVVSYKKGIGFDKLFSQKEIDRIFAERSRSNFHICLKGSEYLTGGVWHNMYIDDYNAPDVDMADYGRISLRLGSRHLLKLIKIPFWKRFIRRYYNPAITLYMENHFVRRAFQWLYPRLI